MMHGDELDFLVALMSDAHKQAILEDYLAEKDSYTPTPEEVMS